MYIDCKQSGFSLLEVSISMTLLSVMWIMLGLIHLQTLRDIKSSYYYSVANQHAVMLASAIQSHPYKWRQVLQEKISNDIASELPNGKLYIECHGARSNGRSSCANTARRSRSRPEVHRGRLRERRSTASISPATGRIPDSQERSRAPS